MVRSIDKTKSYFPVQIPAKPQDTEIRRPSQNPSTSYRGVHGQVLTRSFAKDKKPSAADVIANGQKAENAVKPFEDEIKAGMKPKVAKALEEGAKKVEAFAREHFGETPHPPKSIFKRA